MVETDSRLGAGEHAGGGLLSRSGGRVQLGLCAALLLVNALAYGGYVKDDAYISFRYGRNLLAGRGLVFNAGDRLEGYTNCLWTLFGALAQWLGANPLLLAKGLGLASALGVLFLLPVLARSLGISSRLALIPLVAFASSTSVSLWAMSGLEQVWVAFLWTLALTLVLGGLGDKVALWGSALAVTLACLTRPEGHAVVVLIGALLLAEVALKRRPLWQLLLWCGLVLAVLIPYHLWRHAYFGAWLPNTFLVKGSGGLEAWRAGLKSIPEMLGFQGWGLWIALALAAPLARFGALRQRVFGACFVGFWLLYRIKVGRDEMGYHRLFLPALPLALVLAQGTLDDLLARLPSSWRPWSLRGLRIAAVALAVGCTQFTWSHHRWHNSYVRWSLSSFQDMGRYMAQRSDPGEACIFQDMGAVPWAAPELRFIDTIGILNRDVAADLHAIHLNPFLRGERARSAEGRAQLAALDEGLRRRFLREDARWAAFVAYIPRRGRSAFNQRLQDLEMSDLRLESKLKPFAARNHHGHGLIKDPEFERGYRFVRAWKRNPGYWLMLYERDPLAEGSPQSQLPPARLQDEEQP